MKESELKKYLDELVKKYETKDFCKDDPIRIPHRFKEVEDLELAGFLASIFAYGKRELFLKKVEILFGIMQNKPYEFLMCYPDKEPLLSGFSYRFQKDFDVKLLMRILHKIYKSGKTLGLLFREFVKKTSNLHDAQILFVNYIYSLADSKPESGFLNLVSNPSKGGASKRLNMFLRWMVRGGEVDFGIWDFIKSSELYIPLDVHVARISRQIGLLNRQSNDFRAVVELTKKLSEFDADDPVKYDFAMFGFGVDKSVSPI